jgi:hypothetical protein
MGQRRFSYLVRYRGFMATAARIGVEFEEMKRQIVSQMPVNREVR